MFVEDDEIERQSLQPQVFVCAQDLGDEWNARVLVHSHEQDRQVTRDPELPEVPLAATVGRNGVDIAQAHVA